MILDHETAVAAAPDEVFDLICDAERVAGCMPGATLEGRAGGESGEEEAWSGRVTVKVGPITAGYAGTVRFLETDREHRRLRLQARGADTHGGGDAEAGVELEVAESADGSGSVLRVKTDLVLSGRIVQFGKGPILAVSDRILRQFADNLGRLLSAAPTAEAGAAAGRAPTAVRVPAATAAAAQAPAPAELDALGALFGPNLGRYAPIAGAFAFGVVEGWLISRAFGRRS
ncbi:SRPBCC family protein [Phaeacidiphilus oryzae]|uniref:SRPBCC family protein n=1 Tax=Phaeacidiphilus oryzae TaxID=348818 RepID=UPI00056A7D0A|nr:SRPBCC family protein [Phaeacidiphilus oryzae]